MLCGNELATKLSLVLRLCRRAVRCPVRSLVVLFVCVFVSCSVRLVQLLLRRQLRRAAGRVARMRPVAIPPRVCCARAPPRRFPCSVVRVSLLSSVVTVVCHCSEAQARPAMGQHATAEGARANTRGGDRNTHKREASQAHVCAHALHTDTHTQPRTDAGNARTPRACSLLRACSALTRRRTVHACSADQETASASNLPAILTLPSLPTHALHITRRRGGAAAGRLRPLFQHCRCRPCSRRGREPAAVAASPDRLGFWHAHDSELAC